MATRPITRPPASPARTGLRRLVAAGLSALVLAGCAGQGAPLASSPGPPAHPWPPIAHAHSSGEWMPRAPSTESSWLRAVDAAYAQADAGRGASAWLHDRMSHRRPGEHLAVVMGIDDVMVETHFRGIRHVLPRSAEFVRAAHRWGYAVFYVTGRTGSNELGTIKSLLRSSNVPASAFYPRPPSVSSEEVAKSMARTEIQQQGYTLAVVVAASEASFDGNPAPELAVRLPDFAPPQAS